MAIPADLPTALREWRAGHTAREAAQALDVPYATYVGWEQGRSISQATRGPLLIAIRTPIAALLVTAD